MDVLIFNPVFLLLNRRVLAEMLGTVAKYATQLMMLLSFMPRRIKD